MTQKSGENPPESRSTTKTSKTDTDAQPAQPAAGARTPGIQTGAQDTRATNAGRKQYIVASRRSAGVTTFGVAPLALNVVEQALRASADVEIVDTLGPKSPVTAFADGMPGAPHVIVARMDERKAEMLHQQGQGQLIVEEDQPLTMLDAPQAPPMVCASVAGAPALAVQIRVLAPDETPIAGAEVYLFGSLLPTTGVTNNQGEVTLSLFGDTPQSIRALYVKPNADYWSFYQRQPAIDPTQINLVVVRPLSETFPNFPGQQTLGWGQRVMRMDQVPADRRGQGIKVAIIDSGAAITHEDLRHITKGFDVVGKRANTNNWMVDTIAHGSHCAGIVTGLSQNNVGILGFAPAAEVHACKIFPGGQISQLIDALEYCIERQIDVVNLSLGTEQVSEVLEQQLARLASLGIACIVAAGNSGGAVQYPASSPNVLAVAAIGHLAEFPPDSYHAQTVQGPITDGFFSPRFTCYGPEIAVCAPGVAVLSSVPPNNFAVWDGTSMAAPHVTGLAALVLAHHSDFAGPFRVRSAQRVERLFQILKASARPINLGDPRRTGFGIPDAPTALTLQLGAHPAQSAVAQQSPYGAALGGSIGGPVGGHGQALFDRSQFGQQQAAPAQLNQSSFHPALGGTLGPLAGHPNLGPWVGAAAGELRSSLPFGAVPLSAMPLQPWQAATGAYPQPWWNHPTRIPGPIAGPWIPPGPWTPQGPWGWINR